MELRWFISLFLTFNFVSTANINGQQIDLKTEARLLKESLRKNHYTGQGMDDKLSKETFYKFIALLDPEAIYFTYQDIQSFLPFETQLDEELNGKSWKFLDIVNSAYKLRLTEAEKRIEIMLQKPFDYTKHDILYCDTTEYPILEVYTEDINARYKEYLSLEVLKQMYNLSEISNQADLLIKEPEARIKTKIIERRKIRRILDHPEGLENYVGKLYFDAITSSFDPHSNYMSKTDWQNFESLLTMETLSFGINLDESETGSITIGSITPGGPAWKSGLLNKNDILIELQWPGKEPLDLSASDIQEVEELMDQSNSQKLTFKVKKPSGEIVSVSLVKAKIDNEENTVKGIILNGEKKIGYISLPGFYSEFENFNQGCANDVAKEIIKLKEQNIEGLILDIRYNGGGSLYEGMSLAGIFIDEGPLFSLKGRDGKAIVMKDLNRGTIYDGPLVLMVNSSSASASEVLASTLQDYNRAIIIGGQTYGKATGQIIVPLDTTISKSETHFANVISSNGFLKVTTEKLYRVNGKSAQLKGVTPDITIPDIFDIIVYKESNYPNALPFDSINKKIYYKPLPPLPIGALSKKSIQRISANPSFQELNKFIKNYSGWVDAGIPTFPADYKKYNDTRKTAYKTLAKALSHEITSYKVENTNYEMQVLKADPYKKELNDLFLKRIQSDIYIEESYSIVKDLIQSITK